MGRKVKRRHAHCRDLFTLSAGRQGDRERNLFLFLVVIEKNGKMLKYIL